jgi:hypothetical protein
VAIEDRQPKKEKFEERPVPGVAAIAIKVWANADRS